MPRSSRLPLAAFYGANVCFGAGLFFHGFLYNFYLTALGRSESVMGLAAASLTAGGVAALLPAGALVDRAGSKVAFYFAVAATSSGLALGALAEQAWTIYAAAALAGCGTATWRVAMGPMLMGLATHDQRARAFSWNVAFMVASGAMWMAAAGEAASWLESSGGASRLAATRVALLVGVAGTLLAAPVLAAGVPRGAGWRPAPAGPADRLDVRSWLERISPPRALGPVLVGVLAWMIAAALVQPFFNLYFLREHGLSVDRIGLFFGAAHLVTAVVILGSGELAARWGSSRLLSAWSLLLGPALCVLAGVKGLASAGAIYLVQGLVAPATNPLIDQLLLERAPSGRRGVVAGWRNATTEIGGVVGAGVGGYVLQALSFSALFAIAGVFGLAAAALLITVFKPRS